MSENLEIKREKSAELKKGAGVGNIFSGFAISRRGPRIRKSAKLAKFVTSM